MNYCSWILACFSEQTKYLKLLAWPGVILFISAAQAFATEADCRQIPDALHTLGLTSVDPEIRAAAGVCLVQSHIEQPDVARAVLEVIRNSHEDTLLREDLIDAFAECTLRRKVKVQERLASPFGEQEKAAVDRNLGSVGPILAAAQGVKTIEEVVPVTRFEGEYFHALSEIALDEESNVLLRARAVSALERLSVRVVKSGSYDEKLIRLARETLRTVANRDDAASYFTNAGVAYSRLANAGMPGFSREPAATGRVLSSVMNPSEK